MYSTAQRYFPNHHLEKEIGIAEYELASKRLSNQDKAVTWTSSVMSLVATILGFLAFRISEPSRFFQSAGIDDKDHKLFFLFFILSISLFSIFHISNLLKSQTFSERKIIVIRRMLGVSYGSNTLVLPNWRIEGADDPFSIHLFPGFLSYKSGPILFILATTTLSFRFLLPDGISWTVSEMQLHISWFYLAISWWVVGLFTFRRQLNETNENTWLWIARFAAKCLRVSLVKNTEQVVYRMKLATAEQTRVETDLAAVRRLAIAIEDGRFELHKGINWKGTARAALGKLTGQRLGGGSSITQQLCRSNFITILRPTIRRKIVEMLLAKWVESIWEKTDILDLYLATVRFDKDVYGVTAAYRHFFLDNAHEIDDWEALILIERLGNVNGHFLGTRVEKLLQRLLRHDQVSSDSCTKALSFYQRNLGDMFTLGPDHRHPKDLCLSE